MTDLLRPLPVKVKPALRGVFHFIAFFAAFGGCIFLALSPAEGSQHWAGLVYGLSLLVMLGLSALYHRPMWSPEIRLRLRRLDHGGVVVLIAGTYTPISMFENGGHIGPNLWLMWACALVALIFTVGWTHAPRQLRAGVYVSLGMIAAPLLYRLPALIGIDRVLVLGLGALIYVVGAGVYALRWPNPRPAVFGYHELFHLMVVAAAALHYGVVLDLQQL